MNCLPWVQKESNFQLELQLSLVYQMRWNYSQDYQNLSYLWCSRSHIRQYYFQINTLASQNCIEGGYHTIWQDTSRTSKHIVSSQGSEVHCWRTPSTKKCIQVRQPLKRDYDTKSIQNAFQDCIPGWYQQKQGTLSTLGWNIRCHQVSRYDQCNDDMYSIAIVLVK